MTELIRTSMKERREILLSHLAKRNPKTDSLIFKIYLSKLLEPYDITKEDIEFRDIYDSIAGLPPDRTVKIRIRDNYDFFHRYYEQIYIFEPINLDANIIKLKELVNNIGRRYMESLHE